jgi:hypothetical protein
LLRPGFVAAMRTTVGAATPHVTVVEAAAIKVVV